MRLTLTLALILGLALCWTVSAQDAGEAIEGDEQAPAAEVERVLEELVAFYRFDNVIEGTVVPDATQEFGGLDLVIQGVIEGAPVEVRDDAVHFGSPRAVEVPGLFSTDPATSIVNAIKVSGQLTVEAWGTPASAELTGPARIVSISRGSGERNVTLGQTNDQYILRLRTSATDQQGTPELMSPEGTLLPNQLQHVVVTFDGQTAAMYVDGDAVSQTTHFAGTLNNWDETMSLAIGNETDGGRRWFGSIHLVGFYACALSPAQVKMNFDAGL